MDQIALKCPNCAQEIEVHRANEIRFCMHCGSKIVNNESLKQTVKIDECSKIQNWITLAFDSLKQGRITEAEQFAIKIIETDIKNPYGWYVKGCTSTDNSNYSIECWNKALSYSDNGSEIKKLAANALNDPYNQSLKVERTVKFVRTNQLFAVNPVAKVFINGVQTMSVKNGETHIIKLIDGNYSLLVKSSIRKTEIPLLVKRDLTITMSWDRVNGGIDLYVN